MTSFITALFSFFTAIGDLVIVIAIIGFFNQKTPFFIKFFSHIRTHSLLYAFIITLMATLGSLFYSEIVGYPPCKLCWFQRIFMYPQVILLGIALWKKDWTVRSYSLALSIIGALIALDHYILQTTGTSIIPCSTVGMSVSCSQRFVMEYGYITIPMMSLTTFILVIICFLPKKDQYAINKAL